jgi:hypothetical protein
LEGVVIAELGDVVIVELGVLLLLSWMLLLYG